MKTSKTPLLGLLLTQCCLLSSPATAIVFDIHELGTLGGTKTYTFGVNDSGQVTGYSYPQGSSTYHAFIGDSNGLTDLGTLGGTYSVGYGINNSGEVVGSSGKATGFGFFKYDSNGLSELGTPAGTLYFSPRAINDSGLMSGWAGYQSGAGQLSRATTLQNGNFVDYGFIENGQISQFVGNNEVGQSVGQSYFDSPTSGTYRAVIGENGTLTDLGTLGGTKSWGFAINDHGIATGSSQLQGDLAQHIYYGDENGLIDIGTLGGSWGYGRAINNNGEIVGNSQTASGESHAFYFDGSQLFDLNDLIADLSDWAYLDNATGISNTGYITGTGVLKTGENRSFILTIASGTDDPTAAIPEPASLALLGLGLAGLWSARRWKPS